MNRLIETPLGTIELSILILGAVTAYYLYKGTMVKDKIETYQLYSGGAGPAVTFDKEDLANKESIQNIQRNLAMSRGNLISPIFGGEVDHANAG